MPIASRFRTDKGPNFEDWGIKVSPMLSNLSEAEFKRVQLDGDLETLARDVLSVADRFNRVILDIEATKTEG